MAGSFIRTIGKGMLGGGALGGLGSALDNIGEDTFELGEFARDIGTGAALGGVGFGVKRGLNNLGKLPRVAGLLGIGSLGLAGIGDNHLLGSPAAAELPGMASGPHGPTGGSLGGSQSASGAFPWEAGGDYWDGMEGPPEFHPRSLEDLFNDPGLQRIANDQVIQSNAATMRDIEGIKNQASRAVEANEATGSEYQIQAGQIQRQHAANQQAIVDHAREGIDRTGAETQAMEDATGAALAGNDSTRAEYAAQSALQDQRLADARISDEELMSRLGVGNQDLLANMASVEAAQTKNDTVAIRTSRDDAVSEKRTEAADRWKFDKPTILGKLAEGAMDRETANFQAGLQGWQAKMAMASQTRQAQQQWATDQMKVGASTGDPTKELRKSSGRSIEVPGGSEGTTIKIDIPVWFTMGPQVVEQGLISEEEWNNMSQAVAQAQGGM